MPLELYSSTPGAAEAGDVVDNTLPIATHAGRAGNFDDPTALLAQYGVKTPLPASYVTGVAYGRVRPNMQVTRLPSLVPWEDWNSVRRIPIEQPHPTIAPQMGVPKIEKRLLMVPLRPPVQSTGVYALTNGKRSGTIRSRRYITKVSRSVSAATGMSSSNDWQYVRLLRDLAKPSHEVRQRKLRKMVVLPRGKTFRITGVESDVVRPEDALAESVLADAGV